MQIVQKEGYSYKFNPLECVSCGGGCCRGESGYIWAKYDEIVKMAEFVNKSVEEFATIYLKKVKHRYSLIEKQLGYKDYACIFFDENCNDKTVNIAIKRLRSKIDPDGSKKYIQSVRGIGYKLI